MTPKSAIITGATGYIGSHVAKHLLEQGWKVSIIAQPQFGYQNILSFKSRLNVFEYNGRVDNLIDFFKRHPADVVMHLAAAVMTNPSPGDIPTLIRSNVEFGAEILEAMRQSETRRLISTGSYWQNYNSDNYNPVDLYAATKEAFEKILKFYVEAYGIQAVTLRLFDVYGEDDRRPKLWNKLKEIAGTTQSIDISAGEQLLDMVHVDDVAKAYEAAANYLLNQTSPVNEIFGVSSGTLIPLKEIVLLFEQILGKKINLNWGARKYKAREVMSPTRAYRKLPDWKPMIPIKQGLTKFNTGGG